jgi:hypothetical protein
MSDASQKNSEGKVWQRRGLFAAAAALVTAVVARVTEQPVEAGSDGDVVLGAANVANATTSISTSLIPGIGSALNLSGPGGAGLVSDGSSYGVHGSSNTMLTVAGVLGETPRRGGAGVWGSNGMGVGVRGSSAIGPAVLGDISTASLPAELALQAVAVYGQNSSSYTGNTPGAGGFGVYGISANGHGLVGATGTAGGAAVAGATNGVAGAYAGVFYGPVVVLGDFTVVGGAKSAAVPHPDGLHRRVYCVESPESWFEDFGKGQLQDGCASVAIDPGFAAVVDLTDYHVFLTGYDGERDLTVTNRTASGFAVESSRSNSRGAFSWRLVAKRKDIAARRLETVTVPRELTLPDFPEMTPAPVPRKATQAQFRG